jgi:Cu/Ag efflux protein CusF
MPGSLPYIIPHSRAGRRGRLRTRTVREEETMTKFAAPSLVAVALILPVALPALAQTHAGHGASSAAQSAPRIDGEIRKVDKAGGKLTIKHGEIKQMNMPPMTMMFPVKDKALLDKVKEGDKVLFTLAADGGNMVVTSVEPVKR